MNPNLFRRLNEFDWSTRASNCLEAEGFTFVFEVVEKTGDELIATKNFGPKTLDEIGAVLEPLGLSLGMTLGGDIREVGLRMLTEVKLRIEAEGDLDEEEAVSAALREEVVKLQKEVEDTKTAHTSTTGKLGSTSREKKRLEARVTELESQIAGNADLVEALTHEKTVAQQAAHMLGERVEDYKEQASLLHQTLTALLDIGTNATIEELDAAGYTIRMPSGVKVTDLIRLGVFVVKVD